MVTKTTNTDVKPTSVSSDKKTMSSTSSKTSSSVDPVDALVRGSDKPETKAASSADDNKPAEKPADDKKTVTRKVSTKTVTNPTSNPAPVAKRVVRSVGNRHPSSGQNNSSINGTIANGGKRFDGVVDNRVIPDAGLPTEDVQGILDLEQQNGHGVLRGAYARSTQDVYISTSQIRRFRLRPGDMVKGPARRPKESEKYWGLLKVSEVNGVAVEKITHRVNFDYLTPVYPDDQFIMETDKDVLSTRIIDLLAPIGRGQRGLIVSPPKAGKTTIMKEIANGITTNYPDVHLMAVLVGERPEEVTDFDRSIKGEVAASNFDEAPETQVRVAELALNRAKRLVELGQDVVILLDSITRLARAYNLAIPTSGRTLSGGFDPAALYPPKKFFGAARNFETFDTYLGKKTGSLTILGTALVDTGSRMDDLIYEEFKGTGNMELHLDRKLAERRVYPAIDIQKSSTRQDFLMYGNEMAAKIKTLTTMIDMLGASERTEIIMERLKKTKDNKAFIESLGQ